MRQRTRGLSRGSRARTLGSISSLAMSPGRALLFSNCGSEQRSADVARPRAARDGGNKNCRALASQTCCCAGSRPRPRPLGREEFPSCELVDASPLADLAQRAAVVCEPHSPHALAGARARCSARQAISPASAVRSECGAAWAGVARHLALACFLRAKLRQKLANPGRAVMGPLPRRRPFLSPPVGSRVLVGAHA